VGHAALLDRIWVDDPAGGRRSHPGSSDEAWILHHALECIQDGVAVTTYPEDASVPTVVLANAAFHAISVGAQADFGQRDPLWESLWESWQGDGVYSADITRRDRDGLLRLLGLRSVPIRDAAGRITHRVAVVRDRTEQANLEEVARRNERLAGVGLLAAGIAHEINNPTGSALLAAETALAVMNPADAGGQAAACLRNIVTSMDRCGRIVRTLLRYSRHEPSEKQACSINDVVEQALDLARPYGAARGAHLRLDLDPTVPLAPMNPLEIELVLVNLIRNAVEAGGGSVVVSVATMRTDDGVRVVVRDNGCGMTKEQIAHVFDPLFTTRRRLGGSGLGMSIALGIVEGHQGHMEVQSEEGKGTTVTIDLPVAAGPADFNGKQGQDFNGSDSGDRG
jgi:signal transduction histidine kinase